MEAVEERREGEVASVLVDEEAVVVRAVSREAVVVGSLLGEEEGLEGASRGEEVELWSLVDFGV